MYHEIKDYPKILYSTVYRKPKNGLSNLLSVLILAETPVGKISCGLWTLDCGLINKMATPQGFEPQLSGPKPLVLPLHHGVASKMFNFANLYNSVFFEFFQSKSKYLCEIFALP